LRCFFIVFQFLAAKSLSIVFFEALFPLSAVSFFVTTFGLQAQIEADKKRMPRPSGLVFPINYSTKSGKQQIEPSNKK